MPTKRPETKNKGRRSCYYDDITAKQANNNRRRGKDSQLLLSDRSLLSHDIAVYNLLGVRKIATSSYRPNGSGEVERVNHTTQKYVPPESRHCCAEKNRCPYHIMEALCVIASVFAKWIIYNPPPMSQYPSHIRTYTRGTIDLHFHEDIYIRSCTPVRIRARVIKEYRNITRSSQKLWVSSKILNLTANLRWGIMTCIFLK